MENVEFREGEGLEMLESNDFKKYKAEAVTITGVNIIEIADIQHENHQQFVEITTNNGLKGHAGPIDGLYQFNAINCLLKTFNSKLINRNIFDIDLNFSNLWNSIYPNNSLSAYEIGKDPLTGRDVWQTHRVARHSPTGEIITAFSAIDIAIWDLRGKLSNLPVYKLLGGSRKQLPTYVSCMGNKTPEQALNVAADWYHNKGFKWQKCFLPNRPDSPVGIQDNLDMAAAVRNGLPPDAEIMFDLSRLSEQVDDPATRTERLQWACDMVKGLSQYNPYWVEEPVSPDDIAGYAAIKKTNPNIRISGGEHLYTRWNLKPYLDQGLLDFVQCDPEWCGGISEFIEICDMVEKYYPNVRIIPHGHMILAATQAVAAQSNSCTGDIEYLYQVIPSRMRYYTTLLTPVSGVTTMPDDPGLGIDLDPTKYQIAAVY